MRYQIIHSHWLLFGIFVIRNEIKVIYHKFIHNFLNFHKKIYDSSGFLEE